MQARTQRPFHLVQVLCVRYAARQPRNSQSPNSRTRMQAPQNPRNSRPADDQRSYGRVDVWQAVWSMKGGRWNSRTRRLQVRLILASFAAYLTNTSSLPLAECWYATALSACRCQHHRLPTTARYPPSHQPHLRRRANSYISLPPLPHPLSHERFSVPVRPAPHRSLP